MLISSHYQADVIFKWSDIEAFATWMDAFRFVHDIACVAEVSPQILTDPGNQRSGLEADLPSSLGTVQPYI